MEGGLGSSPLPRLQQDTAASLWIQAPTSTAGGHDLVQLRGHEVGDFERRWVEEGEGRRWEEAGREELLYLSPPAGGKREEFTEDPECDDGTENKETKQSINQSIIPFIKSE